MDMFVWRNIKLIGKLGLNAWMGGEFGNLYGSIVGRFNPETSEKTEKFNSEMNQTKKSVTHRYHS